MGQVLSDVVMHTLYRESRGLAELGQEEEEENEQHIGVHPLSWLLSNNRIRRGVRHTYKGHLF